MFLNLASLLVACTDPIATNFGSVDACTYNDVCAEVISFGYITNCQAFVGKGVVYNDSIVDGFPVDRTATMNIAGCVQLTPSVDYKVLRMTPSPSCKDSLDETILSLPLSSSLNPRQMNGDTLERVVSPMASASVPLLGENASQEEVINASLLTCSNLLPCVPCEGSSNDCIDVNTERCKGQAYRSADACRFPTGGLKPTGDIKDVNTYNPTSLVLDGRTDKAITAWLATNRNLNYVLGANCGLSVLKCASPDLCGASCGECTSAKTFLAVEVGDALFETVANYTMRGWVDITSSYTLQALYQDAADILGTSVSDIEALAGTCADEAKSFFAEFGFTPLPPSPPSPPPPSSPPPLAPFSCDDWASRSLAPHGCASVSPFTRCTQRCRSALTIQYGRCATASKQCRVKEGSKSFCSQNSPYYTNWSPVGGSAGTRMHLCNLGTTTTTGPQGSTQRIITLNYDDFQGPWTEIDTKKLKNSRHCVPGVRGQNFSFILNETEVDGAAFQSAKGEIYPQLETECYTNPEDNDRNQFLCYFSGGERYLSPSYNSYYTYGQGTFDKNGLADSCLLDDTSMTSQCELYYEAAQGSAFAYGMCGLVGGSCAKIGSVDCAPRPSPPPNPPPQPPPSPPPSQPPSPSPIPPPSAPPTGPPIQPSTPPSIVPSSVSEKVLIGVGAGLGSLFLFFILFI